MVSGLGLRAGAALAALAGWFGRRGAGAVEDAEDAEDALDAPEFVVERRHLLLRLHRAEVEALERVEDPLGAVPPLPFGHLHAAWRAFAGAAGPGEVFWSFRAEWPIRPGWKLRRCGYVRIGPGGQWACLLTAQARIPDAAAGQRAGPP